MEAYERDDAVVEYATHGRVGYTEVDDMIRASRMLGARAAGIGQRQRDGRVLRCTRWIVGGVALLVPAAMVATSPALARAADRGTPCVAEWDITISPGVGIGPSHGTYGTSGENGSVVCRGTVDGAAVTGPGTWGVSGT
jgi:hypothetical protein